MPSEIRIDDATWNAASPQRRDDWKTAIVDLVEHGGLVHRDVSLILQLEADRIVLSVTRPDAPHHQFQLERDRLTALVREYLHVIKLMHNSDASGNRARLEALDFAKKSVHDSGAKMVASAAPGLCESHEGYRKVFTLLLSLWVDVTKLSVPPSAHRRHTE